jgi:hypothetical protein
VRQSHNETWRIVMRGQRGSLRGARSNWVVWGLAGLLAEAKSLLTRYQASKAVGARSVCGSRNYRMWQARNVVASFSSCDYLDGVVREATSPAEAAVAAVVAGITG